MASMEPTVAPPERAIRTALTLPVRRGAGEPCASSGRGSGSQLGLRCAATRHCRDVWSTSSVGRRARWPTTRSMR
jgi:hypothetical protein